MTRTQQDQHSVYPRARQTVSNESPFRVSRSPPSSATRTAIALRKPADSRSLSLALSVPVIRDSESVQRFFDVLSWSSESLVNTCQPFLAGISSQRSIVAERYREQSGAVASHFDIRREDEFLIREPTPAAYCVERSGLGLRSAPEHHDWQVASLLVEADCRVEPLSRLASN